MCNSYIIIYDNTDKYGGGTVRCQVKEKHKEHSAEFEQVVYKWGD